MGKYDRLGAYLQQQDEALIPMTFAEIERIVGAPLPKSQKHQAWWSNSTSNNVMTQIWLDAGYRTEQVDTANRRLVFRRVRPSDGPMTPQTGMQESPQMFRHAFPPAGRHPIFGALKGSFTIQPGWHLEGPALDDADMRALDDGTEKTAALIERGLADL